MFLASPEESEWIHIQAVSPQENPGTMSLGFFFFFLRWLLRLLLMMMMKLIVERASNKSLPSQIVVD